jgi:hypothetical protein
MKQSQTFRRNAENCAQLAEDAMDARQSNDTAGWKRRGWRWLQNKTGSMEKGRIPHWPSL